MRGLRIVEPKVRDARRGIAATELAVCMPVIVLVVLATIEACAMIFVQQSLSIAAYEGARVAITPGSDAKKVEYQCQLILDDRGVRSPTISVTPSDIAGASEGPWLVVETSAPFGKNAMAGGWLFGNKVLKARVEMVKER